MQIHDGSCSQKLCANKFVLHEKLISPRSTKRKLRAKKLDCSISKIIINHIKFKSARGGDGGMCAADVVTSELMEAGRSRVHKKINLFAM